MTKKNSQICFDHVTPFLNVQNFAASVDYYVNKLGFEKEFDHGNPPNFGLIQRGDASIFLCEGGLGEPGMWIAFPVSDVDALYEEYKNSGATIIEPPTNFDWGMRVMVIGDPDGHRLRMGSEATGPADEPYIRADG